MWRNRIKGQSNRWSKYFTFSVYQWHCLLHHFTLSSQWSRKIEAVKFILEKRNKTQKVWAISEGHASKRWTFFWLQSFTLYTTSHCNRERVSEVQSPSWIYTGLWDISRYLKDTDGEGNSRRKGQDKQSGIAQAWHVGNMAKPRVAAGKVGGVWLRRAVNLDLLSFSSFLHSCVCFSLCELRFSSL